MYFLAKIVCILHFIPFVEPTKTETYRLVEANNILDAEEKVKNFIKTEYDTNKYVTSYELLNIIK